MSLTPSRINLFMGLANERRRYIVTPPLIGWAHKQNDPATWQNTEISTPAMDAWQHVQSNHVSYGSAMCPTKGYVITPAGIWRRFACSFHREYQEILKFFPTIFAASVVILASTFFAKPEVSFIRWIWSLRFPFVELVEFGIHFFRLYSHSRFSFDAVKFIMPISNAREHFNANEKEIMIICTLENAMEFDIVFPENISY